MLIRKPHVIFLVEVFEAKQGSNSRYIILYTNDSAVNIMILTMHFFAVYIHLKCLQEMLSSIMPYYFAAVSYNDYSNDVYIYIMKPQPFNGKNKPQIKD